MPKRKKILFVLSLGIALAGFFLMWWLLFVPVEKNSQQKTLFHVEKGDGSREIAYHLEKAGFIRSAPLLRVYVLTKGIASKLQAGDYLLSPSSSAAEIARKLATGDIAKETITIIEGWTLKDIEKYLQTKGFSAVFSSSFEGYLFPDTYQVGRGISAQELADLMKANFDKKFKEEFRQEAAKQKKTVHEIVTMASLIEREVRDSQDKNMVSGILWKRLQKGIPLQVDATLTFLLGKQSSELTREDLAFPSPYNTYTNKGLPPGPIANPGLESIRAALYPEASPYWYYLSTPEGVTVFSRTLQEHAAAKAAYLK